jgi:hypothetical protein
MRPEVYLNFAGFGHDSIRVLADLEGQLVTDMTILITYLQARCQLMVPQKAYNSNQHCL